MLNGKHTDNFANWFSLKINKPRLWTEKEWKNLIAKEKIWIWYKHHWMLMGEGNAELDNLLFFMQGEFLMMMGIWATFVKVWGFPDWTILFPVALTLFNKFLQWKIGNWKDKKDLIALQKEIGNKRDRFIREVRNDMQYYDTKRFNSSEKEEK